MVGERQTKDASTPSSKENPADWFDITADLGQNAAVCLRVQRETAEVEDRFRGDEDTRNTNARKHLGFLFRTEAHIKSQTWRNLLCLCSIFDASLAPLQCNLCPRGKLCYSQFKG